MKGSDVNRYLTALIDVNRHIVGVKFLRTKEDYEQDDARHLTGRSNYCVLVKAGMTGKPVKMQGSHIACIAGARTLGLAELPEDYYTGEDYYKYKLQDSVEKTADMLQDLDIIEEKSYGIAVKPIEMYEDEAPDVMLLVTNPYGAMRMSQAYSYHFGISKNFSMAGNQAVCFESTTYPYLNDDMNISMLCAGTRYYGGWDDNELMVGVSGKIIDDIVDGVINTVNTIEPDEKKEELIRRLEDNGLDSDFITMGTGYYYLYK